MIQLPAFSSFRELITTWNESESSVKINSLIENNELVLFFRKEGTIFGAPESARVTFAKMKSPDEDVSKGWLDEANFVAFDLKKAMEGKKVQRVFAHKDLKDMKILDEDEVKKKLVGKGEPADLDTEEDEPTAPDAPAGIEKLDEK
jgi:hypothetical protein